MPEVQRHRSAYKSYAVLLGVFGERQAGEAAHGVAVTDYGEMQWSVRVSARDRKTTAAYVRKQRFDVGAPLTFDVEDQRTSALEYVLGALGADLAAGMKQLSYRRRLDVDSVEALVTGELDNPLAHLGVVGESGSPRIGKLHVKALRRDARGGGTRCAACGTRCSPAHRSIRHFPRSPSSPSSCRS